MTSCQRCAEPELNDDGNKTYTQTLHEFYDHCDIVQISEDGEDDGLTWFHCKYHDEDTLNEFSCQ